MSEVDIESGQRGLHLIAQELNGRNYGVICITPENLRAPWINFEAGALSKSVDDGRVVPLLLDLDAKDVPFPLGQFQAKRIEKVGIKNLVLDINKASQLKIDEARLDTLFESLWGGFEERIAIIPQPEMVGNVTRKESDILEEVVTGIRSIESKFRDFSVENFDRPFRSSKRPRRLHPMMIADLADDFSDRSGDPIFLLMMAGIFRDELPWLAEIFLESYRDIRNSTGPQVEATLLRLKRVLKNAGRGHPMFREMMGDSKESFMAITELPHIIDRYMERLPAEYQREDSEPLA